MVCHIRNTGCGREMYEDSWYDGWVGNAVDFVSSAEFDKGHSIHLSPYPMMDYLEKDYNDDGQR